MEETKIIVIGGSAGSIQVMIQIMESLPDDFPIPIVIVIHRGNLESELPVLLQSYTNLEVRDADDKEAMKPKHIYLAPADYHLLIEKDGTLSLDDSEKILWSRPAIDPTFETAADYGGNQALAILLSGANQDGTAGLIAIKNKGGRVVIQDPLEAEVDYMPLSAIAAIKGAEVLGIKGIINIFKSF